MPKNDYGIGGTIPSEPLTELLANYSSSDLKALGSDVKIAGLVFAQPNNFTKDEILSAIEYFNIRSGKTIDIYFVGYNGSSSQIPKIFQLSQP